MATTTINLNGVQEELVSGTNIKTLGGVSILGAGDVAIPPGATGPQGPQGATGNQGSTGPQGNPGTNGSSGATGPQGNIGLTGPQGPAGNNGVDGNDGAQGSIGNTGSQGPIGNTGPQGPAGNNGVDGNDGAIGPQGSTGNNGADAVVGGVNKNVQFNNAGTLDGADNVNIEDGNLQLNETVDPIPPVSDSIILYSKKIANRIMPKFVGPSGIDTSLQPALFQNRIILWTPGTSTVPLYSGQTATVGAVVSHPTPNANSLGESTSRTQFTTSTVVGNAAGLRSPVATVLRGNATARGGFFYNCRFNQGSLHTLGVQKIVGLSSLTTLLATEPSLATNFIGMCLDSTDSNWQFSRRVGTSTPVKIDLGVAASPNQVFELTMFCQPNGTEIGVRIQSFANDGTSTLLLEGSYSTDIPLNNTFLGLHFQVRNGALAAAHNMAMSRIYLESDF